MKTILSVLLGFLIGSLFNKYVWIKVVEEYFTEVSNTVSQSCVDELKDM